MPVSEDVTGNHTGKMCGLMQRVHALEEFVRKLRFERKERKGWSVGDEIEVAGSNGVNYEGDEEEEKKKIKSVPYVFQMPLHYPRYRKADYEVMPEWKLDNLFREYGLPITGDLVQKRHYAMGAFLWPDEF